MLFILDSFNSLVRSSEDHPLSVQRSYNRKLYDAVTCCNFSCNLLCNGVAKQVA